MPNDIALPIVFPDYEARVDELGTSVPSGHAGILIVNGVNGSTAYFEYGRYDPANRGLVRRVTVPDAPGTLGLQALQPALRRLSTASGHNGRLRTAWVALPAGSFAVMRDHAQARLANNGNAARASYAIVSNNCCTFARDVVAAGGGEVGMSISAGAAILQGTIVPHVAELFGSLSLTMSSPVPTAFMNQLQRAYPGLEYRPPDQWTAEGESGFPGL